MTIELLFVLFCGLVFGSFVTCASYRLPLGVEIVKKPSYCPSCETKLGFRDLWPVFSWLTSRGRCRHCQQKIPVRYPVVELVTAAAFLLIYSRFGLTLPGIIVALFAVALLVMIVVDLEHYIIPDEVHIALLPLGLAYHFAMNTPWEQVLYGFLAGLGLGLALHHGYRWVRKKEGLGYGDVKFFAIAGIWLTLIPFVPFLFFSGIYGVITGLVWRFLNKGERFPFGPALAMALFTGVVFPEFSNLFWNMNNMLIAHN